MSTSRTRGQRAGLGLGTAQFGLDYGISNADGRTPPANVRGILEAAIHGGVEVLDTACDYGNSEDVLGQAGVAERGFRIVAKTSAFPGLRIDTNHAKQIDLEFRQSLRQMKVSRVSALLVHYADDLLKEGGERLFAAMQNLQQAGLVERIGASAYTESQILALVERYPIDILQVPISVLDQRLMARGILAELRRRNIEVHARSVFLQGLLFMNPDSLAPHFNTVREHLTGLHRTIQECGLTAQQVALGFVRALPEVDVVLVGVNSESQLRQLLASADTPVAISDWARFAWADPEILEPSRWPRRP